MNNIESIFSETVFLYSVPFIKLCTLNTFSYESIKGFDGSLKKSGKKICMQILLHNLKEFLLRRNELVSRIYVLNFVKTCSPKKRSGKRLLFLHTVRGTKSHEKNKDFSHIQICIFSIVSFQQWGSGNIYSQRALLPMSFF